MMLVMLKEGQMSNDQNRRKFLGTAAATTAAFTIVPRHVLGGPGVVAPSDKITLGHIGVGTEGLREIQPYSPHPRYKSFPFAIPINTPPDIATGRRQASAMASAACSAIPIGPLVERTSFPEDAMSPRILSIRIIRSSGLVKSCAAALRMPIFGKCWTRKKI